MATPKITSLQRQLDTERAFLDQLPDPLFQTTRRKHRIVWSNQAAKTLLGYDPLNAQMGELFPTPRLHDALQLLERNSEEQRVSFSWGKRPRRELEARIKPLKFKTELGARVLISLHDQTETRRANRMRADFVANASHELRTPLASLYGFIETLQGPAQNDAAARDRFLKIMQSEAGRMRRLVEDLLSLSQIEMNESEIPKGRVDLRAVILACVDALRHRAEEREIQIWVDVPADLPWVQGDAEELHQLFVNLMENAIKYGRDAGLTRIKARQHRKSEPGQALLSVAVSDNGEGIDKVHLPRLTERFYRIDKARSRAMGGTGLGLAIVKHIINRHRGDLEIDSELGVGTTFKVYLPVPETDPDSALSPE